MFEDRATQPHANNNTGYYLKLAQAVASLACHVTTLVQS